MVKAFKLGSALRSPTYSRMPDRPAMSDDDRSHSDTSNMTDEGRPLNLEEGLIIYKDTTPETGILVWSVQNRRLPFLHGWVFSRRYPLAALVPPRAVERSLRSPIERYATMVPWTFDPRRMRRQDPGPPNDFPLTKRRSIMLYLGIGDALYPQRVYMNNSIYALKVRGNLANC